MKLIVCLLLKLVRNMEFLIILLENGVNIINYRIEKKICVKNNVQPSVGAHIGGTKPCSIFVICTKSYVGYVFPSISRSHAIYGNRNLFIRGYRIKVYYCGLLIRLSWFESKYPRRVRFSLF